MKKLTILFLLFFQSIAYADISKSLNFVSGDGTQSSYPYKVIAPGVDNGDGTYTISGSGGGGGTPGGSNTQVQYNNSGAFGGITGATTNGTALTLVAPALGTPASGVLTNCTGLPAASVVAGTLGAGAYVSDTSFQSPIFKSNNADPADSGIVRLGNNELIAWEKAVAGTDWTLGVNASDVLITNAPFSVGTSNAVTTGTIELGAASDTTLSRSSAGVLAVEGVVVDTISASNTLTNKTLTSPTLTTPALGTPASGVLTNCTGLPAASVVAGTLGSGVFKTNNMVNLSNAITCSSNAATVPVTSKINTVTNDSAGNMTITMTTTNAVDGQVSIVRIYDFSAVAKTITWVNTENSTVTAPATSNGSTTLPLTAGFQYNNSTSKWRCLATS